MTDETTDSAPAEAAPAGLTSTATPASITADPSAQASMARALVEGGHWTQEQADAALAAEGTAQGEPGTENALDATVWNQQAVSEMGSALEGFGFNADEIGAAAYVVKRGLQSPPTHEQNLAHQAEVQSMLEGMYGKEKAGYVIGWARHEFQRMAAENPKLVELAERSGAGNSVALIQALAARGWQRHLDATIGK